MKSRALAAWLRWTPLHPQWLLGRRRVPKSLEHLTGVVLDIGAADRWVERHLSKSVHYIALDYPATGRGLYAARPDVFADGSRLPLRDASVDVVVCFEVIEHVRDPETLLAEIVRVLKPGGRTFLSMPFLYPVHDAPFDFQRFTIHGWARSLEAAGLQLIGIRPQGHALGAAAMLGCLAIAGGVARQKLFPMLVLGSIAMPFILLINLLGALSAACWPDWDAMAQGYDVEANKP